jgi:hypothetical protein
LNEQNGERAETIRLLEEENRKKRAGNTASPAQSTK